MDQIGVNKVFGYARVSTLEQSTSIQEATLLESGVDKIFLENYTGTKSSRPQLDQLRAELRRGDVVKILKLDRLARSTRDLLNILNDFEEAGVTLVVLQQNIDTASSEGRFLFNVLSAVAELERSMILARTQQGLAAAKARGRVGGRKAKMSPAQMTEIRNFYNKGKSVTDISALFGVSRASVYRVLDKVPA
jgi:DNA invertase Pin-like site-specific DNA recombinase